MPEPKESLIAPSRIVRRMEMLVTGSLVLLLLAFTYLYLPGEATLFLGQRLGAAGSTALQIGVSVAIGLIITRGLFGVDVPTTGRGRRAEFYRRWYPSRTVMERLQCEEHEALNLWFNYFNKWREPGKDDSKHQQFVANFRRTYAYRLVFHVQWACLVFTLMAVPAFFIRWAVQGARPEGPILMAQCFVAAVALLISLYLMMTTRVLSDAKATGALHKCKEIMDYWRAEVETDVLSKAKDLAGARAVVEAL